MAQFGDLVTEFAARGLIHDSTDRAALTQRCTDSQITAYVGFDPTSDSLHAGNLLGQISLRRMQMLGHRPIVLAGGATGMVGDPSGRSEERNLLDADALEANVAKVKLQLERLLDFTPGPTQAALVDNADWTRSVPVLDFLRDVGKHITVNQMMAKDSVKSRLADENGLSYTEFSYMLLQANDFRHLCEHHDCEMQMGGSDQWGNIVNGIELSRRMDGTDVYGVTTPLITTADGGKMGKTMSGAVWLHEDQLPHFDYWQFWRNTDDRDVGRFLRLFTDLPLDEIARLEALQGAEINEAKKILANEATAMCRGADAAAGAAETARRTFEEGSAGDTLPTFAVAGGITVVDALVALGLAASKGEARRLIKGGGARVDGEKVVDEAQLIAVEAPVRVSAGKKYHGLLTPAR